MFRRRPIFINATGRELGPERPERATEPEQAEARRQELAAGTSACARCGGPVELWRDSQHCARCARAGKADSQRRCSRCGEVGHRVETCTEPPPGWLAAGDEGTEMVPVPITPIEEYARAQALAEAERELTALRVVNQAERRRMLEAERALELRKRELADAVLDKAELRPVKVRAIVDHATATVRTVRVDTGETVRERPLTKAEEMARGGRS